MSCDKDTAMKGAGEKHLFYKSVNPYWAWILIKYVISMQEDCVCKMTNQDKAGYAIYKKYWNWTVCITNRAQVQFRAIGSIQQFEVG